MTAMTTQFVVWCWPIMATCAKGFSQQKGATFCSAIEILPGIELNIAVFLTILQQIIHVFYNGGT